MQTTFPDPYRVFPDEVFLRSLSFLQPPQIGETQAVCKSWRKFVLSSPVLHQVIHLTNQEEGEQLMSEPGFDHDSHLEKITIPLRRQATLSKDGLVDVKLELQSLRWEPQKSGDTDLDKILSILVPSISTLRNLSISIKEEEERSQPLRFGILQNKDVCASLQHLQLDLDSRFCEIKQEDSLWSLMTASRLKTLAIHDDGPVNEEGHSICSEATLFGCLQRISQSLEILEIHNVELKEDGFIIDERNRIFFPRLKSLRLVGLAPSLLTLFSLAELPALSELRICQSSLGDEEQQIEFISLQHHLGPLLVSASNSLESIELQVLDASGVFDMEVWLPQLESLTLKGCYPALRREMMRIKCPQLRHWTMLHTPFMVQMDIKKQLINPADLFSFLETSNSTLEEIDVQGLYIDPKLIDENSPSREDIEKQLPFPNLVLLELDFTVDGYDSYEEAVLKYFPDPILIEERADGLKF